MILQQTLSSAQLLSYAAGHFETYAFLNGNGIQYPHHAFPKLLGMGTQTSYTCPANGKVHWNEIEEFLTKNLGQTIFVQIGYDIKNFTEYPHMRRLKDALDFPLIHFFVPQLLFQTDSSHRWVPCNALSEQAIPAILSFHKTSQSSLPPSIEEPTPHFSRQEYLEIVQRIQQELNHGNVYEINFCNRYSGSCHNLDVVAVYELLNEISPMPFSALFKDKERSLIAASPERFIKKEGTTLISQPIKGTAPRHLQADKDEALRHQLASSLKERTENIMIVDLVRNDLSKICDDGSVKVEELCQVYTFEKVHQMISTVSGQIPSKQPFSSIIQSLFPMGSMTGAPKHKALQVIDELENESRSLFSGSVGYISPSGDFDLNVVIRSLLINEQKALYHFHAGSAITVLADAEQEYQECGIKTLPIRLLFEKLRSTPFV